MTLQALASPTPLAFTHKAYYGVAPVIQVEIAVTTPLGVLTGRSIKTEMLVDSGADITMLDNSHAGPLGVDLSQCPISTATGIGGPVTTRLASVQMYLCEHWFSVPVMFRENLGMHLLGRHAVFDKLYFAFAHGRKSFYAAKM